MLSLYTTRALVRAILQEKWNQSWRFNKWKAGLWLKLAQLGVVTWIVILFRDAPQYSFSLVVSFILLLSVLVSILEVFGKQEGQLYSDRFLQFVHISACPPAHMMLASVIAELPPKVFTSLLTSIVLSNLLPNDIVIWAAPLMFLISILAGLIGDLSGLLLLIILVRVAPGILGATRIIVPGIFIALIIYVAYILMSGIPFEIIGLLLQENLAWIYLIAGILMLPGVGMALSLWLAPLRVGRLYRDGWREAAKRFDTGRKASSQSRWPALMSGPIGAIQAKEWLQLRRNRITYVRLLFLVAGLVAAFFVGPMIAAQDESLRMMMVLAAGLLVALLSYGEVLAAMFVGEGRNIAFYIISGTHPRHLLIGKMLSAIPLGLISLLSTWVFALFSGLSLGQQLSAALIGGLLGIGMIVILIGVAAVGVNPGEFDKRDEKETSSEISEQLPSGVGSWAGIGTALLYWLIGSVTGGADLPIWATLLLVAVLIMMMAFTYVLGSARLWKLLLRGK
ncbi:hypothetical protein M3650_05300 [Paenibacillus sp. MER TA 81-3]|uniref:hypothetical protein n=1 Tax=Paenibacillus sp. MER TA 81-3 TaxID=2939573 RepID=UPI00203EE9BD|nr:hypothetical protein [Paenibacillus sp. MER TA 81-3]MCM3338066.1 hypothetical protein [Paenibacillus sp. MER TA 81-3]